MPDTPHIKGLDQVVINLSAFSRNVISEIVAGCEAVQANLVNDATARVPVVTGNLLRSIKPSGILITDDNVQAVVIADAEYASYVEGVPDSQGRMGRGRKTPFMGPALLGNIQIFQNAIRAAVARARAA